MPAIDDTNLPAQPMDPSAEVEEVQKTHARQVSLLHLFAYAIFLFVPILGVASLHLFISGWQARAGAIEEALCNAFLLDPHATDPTSTCVSTHSHALQGALKRPTWNDIFKTWSTETRLALPNVFALETDTTVSSDGRCKDLGISSFDIGRITTSQDATYDSIARRIEACNQQGSARLLNLCTGTRVPHRHEFCARSLDFLERMQKFDRSYDGRTATVSLIISNITFGIFQLAALLLALTGINVAIRRSLRTGATSDPRVRDRIDDDPDFVPSPKMSALDSAYYARSRAQGEDEQKRLQTFLLYKDAFRVQVTSAFDRINNWGDIVVLIGLLGTLWGMLILFAALAESGSAEPVTAELAKSKMLGSLGLAFGTTIFAGILRLVYMFIIPHLRSKAEATIDRTFLDSLSGVKFDDIFTMGFTSAGTAPVTSDYASIGAALMRRGTPKARGRIGAIVFDAPRSISRYFLVSVLAFILITLVIILLLS